MNSELWWIIIVTHIKRVFEEEKKNAKINRNLIDFSFMRRVNTTALGKSAEKEEKNGGQERKNKLFASLSVLYIVIIIIQRIRFEIIYCKKKKNTPYAFLPPRPQKTP